MNPARDDDWVKYELIGGRQEMMAAASLPHLDIQSNLHHILKSYLKGKRCKVYSEAKVVFDEENWLQPDVLVVCDPGKMKLNHIDGAPDFVAEVLSPATQSRDYNEKKKIYEKYGVKEYWIIDPMGKNIIVYRLQGGGYDIDYVYHLFSDEEWDGLTAVEKGRQKLTLKISLYDDLVIDIKDIFEG